MIEVRGAVDESDGVARPVLAGGLSVTTAWRGDCRIVTAVGQVDLANTHQLHYALSTALDDRLPLIADLSGVTFLDSRGLRTLMMMQRNADLRGARLLVVPSAEIAALITLGAADVLTVCPSLETALVAVRMPAAAAGEASNATA